MEDGIGYFWQLDKFYLNNNLIIDIDKDVFWILCFFLYFDLLYNNLIELEDGIFLEKFILKIINFVYN